MPLLIANYERERAALTRFASERCDRRIVLLRGDSGFGKTDLINWWTQAAGTGHAHVPIQLRGRVVTVAEILFRLTDGIGWDRFPSFGAAISKRLSVSIEGVTQTGSQNTISIAIEDSDPANRGFHLASLTRSWFVDASALGRPLIVLVDTFEMATPEVAEWIAGPFLGRVAQTATIRVLIAGQAVPDRQTIEWGDCCEQLELNGVPDGEDWIPVVNALDRRIGATDPLSWLQGICSAFQGRPKEIRQAVEALPRRETSR